MAVIELTDGNDDGTRLGQSATDKLGFYGLATPIVQPTVVATVDTTIATTGITAEATLTPILEAHAIAINSVITKLRALGLMASA